MQHNGAACTRGCWRGSRPRLPDVSDDDDKAPRDDEEGPEESKDGGGEESK